MQKYTVGSETVDPVITEIITSVSAQNIVCTYNIIKCTMCMLIITVVTRILFKISDEITTETRIGMEGTVRVKKKCPKVTVVTQYFCNINSRYYIAYYCVGNRTVHTKKTGHTKGRGVEAC